MDRMGRQARPPKAGSAIGRAIGAITVAAAVLAAAAGLVSAAVQTVTVRSQPDMFDAARLTIAMGDTVTWVVGPGNVHTVTSGTYNASGVHADGLFDSSSLAPGEEFAFMFTSPGEYPYVCAIHADSGMVGRITVLEATVARPGEEGPDDGQPPAVILALIVAGLIVVIGGTRLLSGRRS